MDLIASQYAIILHDPELRSTLAKQGQPRHVGPARGSARDIVLPWQSLAFKVRLLMTTLKAARPVVVTERAVAE
jgi:hypothetical protein